VSSAAMTERAARCLPNAAIVGPELR